MAKGLLASPDAKQIQHLKSQHNNHHIANGCKLLLQIQEEEEQHFLQNGTFTTAEQRPNAYIPEDENVLPIPRPYGALAPFKPTEPGSNMRHIRKPTITPIEI